MSKLQGIVNGRNVNELKQYNTLEQKKRTAPYFDSIVLNHYLRLAHLAKKGLPKSQYLNAGHLTIMYTWWLWIPVEHRETQWVSLDQMVSQIKKLLNFDMDKLNVKKYMDKLVELTLLEHIIGPKGKNLYKYRKVASDGLDKGIFMDEDFEPVHPWDF